MTLTHVSIYCLSNIRAPWVVVYEPHPWGHGALRVKEGSALLIYQRPPSVFERNWLAEAVTHYCRTFQTVEGLLDYEDGQHEHADQVREMVELRRTRVEEILAQVEAKRAGKRREEARRRHPLI